MDHIFVAVKDPESAKKIWGPMLGKSGPDDVYVDEREKINGDTGSGRSASS